MSDLVSFQVTVVATTEKAVLVDYEGTEHWLPLSKIECDEGLEKGDLVTVEMPQWLVDRTGMG